MIGEKYMYRITKEDWSKIFRHKENFNKSLEIIDKKIKEMEKSLSIIKAEELFIKGQLKSTDYIMENVTWCPE